MDWNGNGKIDLDDWILTDMILEEDAKLNIFHAKNIQFKVLVMVKFPWFKKEVVILIVIHINANGSLLQQAHLNARRCIKTVTHILVLTLMYVQTFE